MQIQKDLVQFSRRFLNQDAHLQNLFISNQKSNVNQMVLQQKTIEKVQIKINKSQIDKAYFSQGQQKMNMIKRNPRKTNIIRKMKIKQRKRKSKRNKMQIQLLQNKVFQLQKQLQKTKKLNQLNKQYLKRLSQGEHIMNGLFVRKQGHVQNIKFLLDQKQINNEALVKQYSNMRFRQGVYGKDRTKAINYYFSQISQLFFPDTLKYFIKTALNQQQFFNKDLLKNYQLQDFKSSDQIINIMNLSKQSIRELHNFRGGILTQKNNLDQKFHIFYETKCDIMKIARRMQMIIDKMQRYCNHVQISQMILFADQYRFKKNISVKQFYKDVFDEMNNQKYQYDINNLFGEFGFS